jgi:putative transposase
MSGYFANAFYLSFNSANASDEARLGAAMTVSEEAVSRAEKVADVLRPLGRGPLSKKRAVSAANLLGVIVCGGNFWQTR